MKKKSSILLILAILFTATQLAFAQSDSKKPQISWGDKTSYPGIIYSDANNFYSCTFNSRGAKNFSFNLNKFNKKMILKRSEKIKLGKSKKNIEYESIFRLGKELILLTSFMNRKTNKKYLYSQSVNKQTLSLRNDMKILIEIDSSPKSRKQTEFEIMLSGDLSKLLVYCNHPHEKEDSTRSKSLFVFDQELKEIWRKEFKLPYFSPFYEIRQRRLDPFGNLHFLLRIYDNDESTLKDEEEQSTYSFEILSLMDNGTRIAQYPFQFKGNYPVHLMMFLSKNQKPRCIGYYGIGESTNAAGSFLVELSKENEKVTIEKYDEFPPMFLEEDLSSGEKLAISTNQSIGKNSNVLKCKMKRIFHKPDGGMYLVGEQGFVEESIHYVGASKKVDLKFRKYNILVSNYSPNGEILWTRKIIKRQITKSNPRLTGFAVMQVDDMLHFMFNDHPKNFSEENPNKLKAYRGKLGATKIASIDSDGEITEKALFSYEERHSLIYGFYYQPLSENRLLLAGKKAGMKYLILTF